jgi:hypothetical protein
MTIERRAERPGVNVYLDRGECELLMRLARDDEKVHDSKTDAALLTGPTAPSYFSLSLALGKKIRAMFAEEGSVQAI